MKNPEIVNGFVQASDDGSWIRLTSVFQFSVEPTGPSGFQIVARGNGFANAIGDFMTQESAETALRQILVHAGKS